MSALPPKADICSATRYVRFGSEADICGAPAHVRFTPDSDRESGNAQKVMSALPPKADICGALAHVCFGPEADIGGYCDVRPARSERYREYSIDTF
jgi:hypothetical protein